MTTHIHRVCRPIAHVHISSIVLLFQYDASWTSKNIENSEKIAKNPVKIKEAATPHLYADPKRRYPDPIATFRVITTALVKLIDCLFAGNTVLCSFVLGWRANILYKSLQPPRKKYRH
jgi:hypothetical protein